MKQSHRWQRTLLLCLLSLSVVAPVIFVSRRLQLVTRDGRREFLDDLSSVKYRTDPLKLNAVEQEDSEELEEPKQVVYKENDFGSKNSNDSEKNNDYEDSEDLEEPKQVVYKENDFGSKNSTDSEKNNDYEDSEELEESRKVVYKENDFGSKNSDDLEKNNESEDLRIEGSRNNYLEKKEFDHDDDETQDQEAQQKGLSSTYEDQEDSEELEEPKQVVYKENDFGSKNSDDLEKNNDSEDSRIEGSRNNYLKKKEFDHDDETQDREAQQKELSSTDGDQEDSEELEEAKQVGYKENDFGSTVRDPSEKNIDPEESRIKGSRNNFLEKKEFDHDETKDQEAQQKGLSSTGRDQKKFNTTVMDNRNIQTPFQRKKVENIIKVTEKQSGMTVSRHHQISRRQSRKVTNQTVMEIKDQIIRARAYLGLSPPSSTSHLVKELKMRIREMEHAVGEATKDSDLSRSALQKMKRMEGSLSKANRAFPNCAAMAAKLRAMHDNAEEQVRSHQHEVTHLVYLAARTTPKGLHCLSMQLTADYFSLRPEDRKLPNENKIHDPELYHYAVFSDNVLACGVVVNSTVSNSKEQEKLVLHIVTNSLNFPSFSMWFLLNPPGNASVHIQNIDNFEWLSKYNTFKKQNASDPRYTSELNYLRFYLPDIFPTLNKILLFDHDVVVQQDLSTLWNINMNEKVIAGVGTCQEGETSFRRMDMFINFSNPYIAKRFDVNACTWAFGMNLFDLQQWRRHNLTGVYHKYLQKGSNMPLFSTGSLPLGWLTFYNKTMVLDRRWHIVGLGYDSDIDTKKIEQAAVIHFDGIKKPWMDIGYARYKSYWSKFIKFDLPLLQRCNIQA
ncbi:probable galacturonosyltransferase 6 [Vicia villosa]|uniref:probable galacturonosyltransferase 6 n=1 Tax=Vicia villosa TaxID=3911 RepID=UPI00273C7349|nr:probable galacturonosyltransferase 6 [Vicia villosa]